MSLFGDRLRTLEEVADRILGETVAILYAHDRRAPESERWSCWIAQRPELRADAADAHAAMERLLSELLRLPG